MGWLAGYDYRKPIPITGEAGAGADYQVKLEVHPGAGSDGNGVVYLSNHAADFPNDIRFTDDDGTTELDHWLEGFDIENNQAIFWIEVKDDLGSNQSIYIYYGKSGAASDSDGDETFLFFDDFEAASLDAAKWDVRQGAVSLISEVADGAFMEHTGPVAQYYSGTYNRTYFVYLTMSKKVQIRYYDHDADVVSSPTTLHTYGSLNDHGAPSILILSNGKILVFYSLHNSALYVRKSTNAEDISAWEGAVTIEADNAAYSQPILLSNGDVWIFYRYHISDTHRTWCYKASDDDGETWDAGRTTLVDFGDGWWIYGRVAQGGDTIHVAWNRRAGEGVRDNIYYIYSPDNGTAWKTRAGVAKTPPIDVTEADLVYDTGVGEESGIADIKLDGSNDPYIVFADDYVSDPSDARFAFYDAGWETHFICDLKQVAAGPARPAHICIDDADVYKVYAGVPDAGKSEIQEWASGDLGDNWAFSQSITDASAKDNWRPNCVKDYQAPFKLLWQVIRAYTDYTDFDAYLSSYPNGSIGFLELMETVGARGLIDGKTAISQGAALHLRAQWSHVRQTNTHFCVLRKPDDWNFRAGDFFGSGIDSAFSYATKDAGVQTTTTDVAMTTATERHIYKILWTLNLSKAYQDAALKVTHNTNVPSIDTVVAFYEGNLAVGTICVDWCFVRKYITTEPVVGTAGAEEAGEGVVRVPRTPAYALDPMIF